MLLLNCTPHDIKLNNGEVIKTNNTIARVSSSFTEFDENNICLQTFGDIINLPPKTEGVVYIVSALVLSAGKLIGRDDLVAPATGHKDCVRNSEGHIVSVPGFVK